MKLTLSMVCDELSHSRPDILPAPLLRYEKPSGPRSVKSARACQRICGVRMLNGLVKGNSLDPELLYIGQSDHVGCLEPVGAHILCLGQAPSKGTPKEGFRIIELAPDIDPFEVLDAVSGIFERYAAWHDEFMDAIMGRLPLPDLLIVGCRMFRNPVSFVNPALENVALAGAELPEDIEGSILETILAKGYSPFEAIKPDERDRLISEIESHQAPYLSKPQEAYADGCFLIAPVDDGSRPSSALASTDICEPFTDGQMDLMALIAEGIETRLKVMPAASRARNELALVAEEMFRSGLVDEGRMSHALKRYRWSGEDDFVLLCASGSHAPFLKAMEARVLDIIDEVLTIRLDEQLVLVVNSTRSKGHEASLSRLDSLFKQMGLCAGASYLAKGFAEVGRAYEQSRIALQVAADAGEQGILRFEGNHARCAVHALGQRATALALVHPDVLALSKASNASVLIETLACFLRHGGNASRTAQELFLHRSTLLYRLDRIQSIMDIALKDLSFDDFAALLLSCLILMESHA